MRAGEPAGTVVAASGHVGEDTPAFRLASLVGLAAGRVAGGLAAASAVVRVGGLAAGRVARGVAAASVGALAGGVAPACFGRGRPAAPAGVIGSADTGLVGAAGGMSRLAAARRTDALSCLTPAVRRRDCRPRAALAVWWRSTPAGSVCATAGGPSYTVVIGDISGVFCTPAASPPSATFTCVAQAVSHPFYVCLLKQTRTHDNFNSNLLLI